MPALSISAARPTILRIPDTVYSNALLGIFQSYLESTNRANSDTRQWEIESYVQDNWRVNRRLTIDAGVRVYHVGPYGEFTHATAGFFPRPLQPGTGRRSLPPRFAPPACPVTRLAQPLRKRL